MENCAGVPLDTQDEFLLLSILLSGKQKEETSKDRLPFSLLLTNQIIAIPPISY